MRRLALCVLLLGFAFTSRLAAQDQPVVVKVTAATDSKNTPVCVPLSLPTSVATFRYARLTGGGLDLEGQLTAPSLTTHNIVSSAKDTIRRDLHFIAPELKKGATFSLTAKLFEQNNAPDTTGFWWMDGDKGRRPELMFDVLSGIKRRPVLRYMNAAFDDSSKDARDRTYKVFHHLFDPDGKTIVTNGGQTDLKEGETRKLLFPHHRGIMYAFNKCSYGEGLKKKADTWHCTGDAHVAHEKFLATESGGVLGRHRVALGWHGEKKERFAEEHRELAVYNLPGGTLVEFASLLKTTGGKVRLDGDPQHAGFQFRASNDVAEKTAKQTYYLRPDGKDEPGKTRNWPADKTQVDLPWYAMSFVFDGQRYTVCYLNHPKNPKETRFSERDYGRFGGYFEYDLTAESPLIVNYRVWLQKGEMTGAQAQALFDGFAAGPKVAVK